MKRKIVYLLIACCIIVIHFPGVYAKDNISPEQLVAEHLKSIGEPDALSQAKTTSIAGTSEVNFILGMQGPSRLTGTSMIVSQESKMGISIKFDDLNYPGEYFAYDGKSVTVGHMQPGQKSPIADFIHRYNKIMKSGILGGVFSKAWPLLDVKNNRPNMKVRKTMVDMMELYELEYRPRDNHSNIKIRLYFDPETYRHVLTEYKVQASTGNSSNTLTESFGNFKKAGALTLPHSYMLTYKIDAGTAAPDAIPAMHASAAAILSAASISSVDEVTSPVFDRRASSGFIANWKINVQEIGLDTPDIPQNLFKAE